MSDTQDGKKTDGKTIGKTTSNRRNKTAKATGWRSTWTPQEEARLTHMYCDVGLSSRDCAAVLGKSPTAVERKRNKLGLRGGRSLVQRNTREGVLARLRERNLELAQKIHADTEQMIEGGKNLAMSAIEAGEAKDYNHATAGYSRLVGVLGSAQRGFDAAGAGKVEQVAGGNTVNLFFFQGRAEKVIETASGSTGFPVEGACERVPEVVDIPLVGK